MKLLLDSNAYSKLEGGDRRLAGLVKDAEGIMFSMIVVGELLAGFRNGSKLAENLSKLDRFLRLPRVTVLPVSRETADQYGRIHTQLRRKGRPIPTNDVWIAAHAMESGADLVSFDPHFGHVEGLAWIKPSS